MTNILQDHPSVISKKYILGPNDRCDKCSAQALVKVKGLNGELTFCNHHYEKIVNNPISYEKLFHFAIEFIDEREKLVQQKPIGGI